MNIQLPAIIEDNYVLFFCILEAVVVYSDPDAKIDIKRNSEGFLVVISPNNKDFRQDIIDNLLLIHRHLKTPIKFSSSLAISNLISYSIRVEEYLN